MKEIKSMPQWMAIIDSINSKNDIIDECWAARRVGSEIACSIKLNRHVEKDLLCAYAGGKNCPKEDGGCF